MKTIKMATCGCGSCGCVCYNHMDIPRGVQPGKCALHSLQKLFAVLMWCGAMQTARDAWSEAGAVWGGFVMVGAAAGLVEVEVLYPLHERITDIKLFHSNILGGSHAL